VNSPVFDRVEPIPSGSVEIMYPKPRLQIVPPSLGETTLEEKMGGQVLMMVTKLA
jgi:hypothetical protein